MTSSQQRKVDALRRHFEQEMAKSPRTEEFSGYELKQFEVTPSERTSLVFLRVVVGLVGDEGTMAAVFARDDRLIAIGPRGALHLLNAKYKTRSRGWFNAVHALTR